MPGDLVQVPQEVWKFGTTERVARRTPIMLQTIVVGNAIAGRWSTMRRFRTTAGYQVTAGTTLIITRILFSWNGALSFFWFVDGTSDIGLNSAAAPAGAILNDDPIGAGSNGLRTEVANRIYDLSYYLEVPAGRYLSIGVDLQAINLGLIAFGHEE